MPIRTTMILLIAATMLTGCGRRGSLQEPGTPDTPAPALSQPAPAPGEGVLLDAQSPGAQEPPEARPVAAPEQGFFLDPLI